MDAQIPTRKIVSICETQPLTVKGLFHLLDATDDLRLGSSHAAPAEWMISPAAERTDILIIDKGLGGKRRFGRAGATASGIILSTINGSGCCDLGHVHHRSRSA